MVFNISYNLDFENIKLMVKKGKWNWARFKKKIGINVKKVKQYTENINDDNTVRRVFAN